MSNTNEAILSDGGNISDNQLDNEQMFFEETSIKDNSSVLSKDDFNERFNQLFEMCGDIWDMPEFKINQAQTLEVAGAKVTADKLYYLAEKYPLMHFLIEPSGGWLGDFWLMGVFCFKKADVVSQRMSGLTILARLKGFFKKTGAGVENTGILKSLFKKETKVSR